jgi:hypothetical protein
MPIPPSRAAGHRSALSRDLGMRGVANAPVSPMPHSTRRDAHLQVKGNEPGVGRIGTPDASSSHGAEGIPC